MQVWLHLAPHDWTEHGGVEIMATGLADDIVPW